MPRRLVTTMLCLLLGAVAGVLLYRSLPLLLQTASDAPLLNEVVIDGQLATAGQPSVEQLNGLAARGIDTVINLAPPQTIGSVADEAYRLGSNGVTYLNIPVAFKTPTASDFERFASWLAANQDRRVLVHCQINKRASVFVYLYRVLRLGADPDDALEQVHDIWVPDAVWQEFIDSMLADGGHRH